MSGMPADEGHHPHTDPPPVTAIANPLEASNSQNALLNNPDPFLHYPDENALMNFDDIEYLLWMRLTDRLVAYLRSTEPPNA